MPAVCAVTRTLLDADHVAVSFVTTAGLHVDDGSDPIAAALDSAQAVAGDGPLLDGLRSDLPLVANDLASRRSRWPLLTDVLASTSTEVGSIVVIPLRVGGARLGVISAYRSGPTDLEAQAYADAVLLGTLSTEMLLADRSGGPLPGATPASMTSPIVQQAVGMLAERHGISVLEAQVRLRSMAFGRNEALDEIAGQIVRREDLGEATW
ncbi:MAG: hypothetical protein RIR49_2171 [Actinomycetota bacterium]